MRNETRASESRRGADRARNAQDLRLRFRRGCELLRCARGSPDGPAAAAARRAFKEVAAAAQAPFRTPRPSSLPLSHSPSAPPRACNAADALRARRHGCTAVLGQAAHRLAAYPSWTCALPGPGPPEPTHLRTDGHGRCAAPARAPIPDGGPVLGGVWRSPLRPHGARHSINEAQRGGREIKGDSPVHSFSSGACGGVLRALIQGMSERPVPLTHELGGTPPIQ